jgi:hypothetical protein
MKSAVKGNQRALEILRGLGNWMVLVNQNTPFYVNHKKSPESEPYPRGKRRNHYVQTI